MPDSLNLGDILRLPARADRLAYVDLRDVRRPRAFGALEFDQLIAAVARGRLRGATGSRAGANRRAFQR